jgi:hypothetical protein
VVTRLEKAGYVRRTPNPADARSVIVEPINTDEFLQKMSALLGPLRARMKTLVSLYSKKDLQLILRFMTVAAQISREETVPRRSRYAVSPLKCRRLVSQDPLGASPRNHVGSSKRPRASARSRRGRSKQHLALMTGLTDRGRHQHR